MDIKQHIILDVCELVTSFLIFSMKMGRIDTLLQNILLFKLPSIHSMYPTRWLITVEYGNLK